MPSSDDFGTEDDDTAFIVAATQAGAFDEGDFQPNQRPSKRPRLLGPELNNAATSRDTSASEINTEGVGGRRRVEEHHHEPHGLVEQSGADYEPESDAEYYFPGEIKDADDQPVKATRHKIHVPKEGGYLARQIFTQTQVDLDSDPSCFRGPIWKKPLDQPLRPDIVNELSKEAEIGRVFGSTAITTKGLKQTKLNGFGEPTSKYNIIRPPNNHPNKAPTATAKRSESNATIFGESINASRTVARETAACNIMEELADLPSDAFSSSSPEKSPNKDVIAISSQSAKSQQLSRGIQGQQKGLKQMTIFGQPTTQDMSSSQAAKKKHSWPLKSQDEPPTHHRLDNEAMESWVFPTNIGTFRDYQFNIVSRSLFHNTLVALPTGLGKTFIAATVMLNYYRWTKDAQIVFMAPTKPLIAQQMEACYHIVGIPRRDTVLMTGETVPGLRAEEWLEKRVFFMTPQTVINDLKTGICDPKKIVLLVVDEAHKASGGYAYTEVVAFLRRFNNSFRVLALTATPGSNVEAVQGVIDSLGIARVELRTEQSLDIRQYTHEKLTETEIFEWSDEQALVMEQFSKALQPSVDKLRQQNAYWSKDPMQLNAFALTQARQKWMSSDTGRKAPMPLKGMVNNLFATLSSLAHSIGLLKFHGIGPFYSGVLAFQREVESGQKKGKTVTAIAQSDHFIKTMSLLRGWTNNPDFIGHPKLEYLRQVVLNHFLDAGEGRTGRDAPPLSTRIMIFASYRDSTEEICRVLKRNEPMVRPHVFVGQAASKGSEGMDQKRQNEVIQDFKSDKYNTLVATSIGEEGLDIGDVDLIVCYDASSSPIRMLQRIGRTGRKRVGRVVLLLMKGKEENDYAKAQDSYSWIQKSIADASRYTYRDEQSPRILPKNVQPQVDKRIIEIPVENSQPIDLNEKGRKARGKGKIPKRPAKKFHMPDGVRTGFVKVSRLDSDDDNDTQSRPRPTKKPSTKKAPPKASMSLLEREPDVVQLPFLDDVLLNDIQQRELTRKYAQPVTSDGDAIIRAPDASRVPEGLRVLVPTKYIRHGRSTIIASRVMETLSNVRHLNTDRIEGASAYDAAESNDDCIRRLVPSAGEYEMDVEGGRPSDLQTSKRSGNNTQEQERGQPKHARGAISIKPLQEWSETTKAKGRSRPRQAISRTVSYGSAAAEGEESSPEATPANMRIGTQGIDLGSRDTSGEDEDEEPDSDLDDFVVRSDRTVEMASSSQRLPDDTQPSRRATKPNVLRNRRAARKALSTIMSEDSDADPIDDLSSDGNDNASSNTDIEELPPVTTTSAVRSKKRKVVDSSDTDD